MSDRRDLKFSMYALYGGILTLRESRSENIDEKFGDNARLTALQPNDGSLRIGR